MPDNQDPLVLSDATPSPLATTGGSGLPLQDNIPTVTVRPPSQANVQSDVGAMVGGMGGALTTPRTSPLVMTPAGSGLAKDKFLDWVVQRESGGQNVYNYRYHENPNYYTASGYYQITNSTWAEGAKAAGIDTSKYPTAISAPRDVQAQVASAIYDRYGEKPWAASAPKGGMASLGGSTPSSGVPVAQGLPALGGVNPLALGGATQPGQPVTQANLSGLVGMALLQKMVPSTHTLVPVHFDPFKAPEMGEPPSFDAPKLHPMPGAGVPPVRSVQPVGAPQTGLAPKTQVVPQMPGSRLSTQSMMESLLGNTGRPSLRDRVRGGDSQYSE